MLPMVSSNMTGIPIVSPSLFFFFFNETATTEIYTLSLHDALPISADTLRALGAEPPATRSGRSPGRSEEHTSELQSRVELVCRRLLQKKNALRLQGHPGTVRGAAHQQLGPAGRR